GRALPAGRTPAGGRRPRGAGPTETGGSMSLVGSLEDLGLADILQIASLSRKSGVLVLSCEDGEGRIAFRDGLVYAASVKGGPEDRATLMRQVGLAEGAPAREVEAVLRRCAEQAVARMFEWRTGAFRFDLHDDLDPRDRGLALATGLSPQYLTME